MTTNAQAYRFGGSSLRPLLRSPDPCRLPGTASPKQQPFTRLLLHSPMRRCRTRCSFFSESPLDYDGNGQETLTQQHKTATRFIDDKLIDALSQKDGVLRQIVLLTDGADQRLYRLLWPPTTLIFHVSSCPTIQVEKKEKKVPKSCLFRHVFADLGESAGSDGWTERLRSAGYQGDRPSIWAMQGINFLGLSKLQKILENAGSLAMKGSFVIGELPNTTIGCMNEDAARELLEKIFMSCGFHIKSISYEKTTNGDSNAFDGAGAHILFVAEQLRLSDDQVKKAMREMNLAEESGDEDTFEDW